MHSDCRWMHLWNLFTPYFIHDNQDIPDCSDIPGAVALGVYDKCLIILPGYFLNLFCGYLLVKEDSDNQKTGDLKGGEGNEI